MSEVDLFKIARLAAEAKAQSKYDHPDRVMLPDYILQELGFPNTFDQKGAGMIAKSFPHEPVPQPPQDNTESNLVEEGTTIIEDGSVTIPSMAEKSGLSHFAHLGGNGSLQPD